MLVVPHFSVQPITCTMKSAGLSGILPISSVRVKEIDFLCHRSVLVKAALCSVYRPELSCWPLQLTQTVTQQEPDWTGGVGDCSHSFSWCLDEAGWSQTCPSISGTKLVNLLVQSQQGSIFLHFLPRDYINLFMSGRNTSEILLNFLNKLLLEIITVHSAPNRALKAGCVSGFQLLEPVISLHISACSCNRLQVPCL